MSEMLPPFVKSVGANWTYCSGDAMGTRSSHQSVAAFTSLAYGAPDLVHRTGHQFRPGWPGLSNTRWAHPDPAMEDASLTLSRSSVTARMYSKTQSERAVDDGFGRLERGSSVFRTRSAPLFMQFLERGGLDSMGVPIRITVKRSGGVPARANVWHAPSAWSYGDPPCYYAIAHAD